MSLSQPALPFALAIVHLEDVCVRIQEGMERFLRTAALEKTAEVEATFRWLSKRGIRVALLSDHNREDTNLLLERLNWKVGDGELIDLVLTDQRAHADPIAAVLEAVGATARRTLALVDTPRLLNAGHANRLGLTLGALNGGCSYAELAGVPHHDLLDEPVQLVNYLLPLLAPLPSFLAPAAAPSVPPKTVAWNTARRSFLW